MQNRKGFRTLTGTSCILDKTSYICLTFHRQSDENNKNIVERAGGPAEVVRESQEWESGTELAVEAMDGGFF